MKGIVKSFTFFGWCMKLLGQWRMFFFRGNKTEIKVQRNKLRKLLSQKRKFTDFPRSWVNLFSNSAETFARIVKTASNIALEVFEEKPCLKLLTRFKTYLHFEPKTRNLFSESFFRGCHNCNPPVPKNFSRKSIFFPEIYCFLYQFWSSSDFLCLLAN